MISKKLDDAFLPAFTREFLSFWSSNDPDIYVINLITIPLAEDPTGPRGCHKFQSPVQFVIIWSPLECPLSCPVWCPLLGKETAPGTLFLSCSWTKKGSNTLRGGGQNPAWGGKDRLFSVRIWAGKRCEAGLRVWFLSRFVWKPKGAEALSLENALPEH